MAAGPGARMAALYDASAVAYERHWAPALLRHSRDLVARLGPATGPRRILEVATGTGALLPALIDAAGPGGRVVGVDRSLGMLRRVATGTPRAQADATALPVRSASVDVAVAAFVLFLVPDAARAAAELARVLRPGGALLVATWGEQRPTEPDTLVVAALDEAGAPVPEEMHRSDSSTDSPAALRDLLEGAGLHDVRTESRPLDARFDATSVLEMRTSCGTLGWRFGRLGPAAQEQVRSRLADRFARLDAAAFTDTSEVLLTTARRPG